MAFSTKFCPIQIDLSGNTVRSQATYFQNETFSGIFKHCAFVLLFVYILLLLVFHLIRSENNKTKHWVALLLNKERSNKLTIEDWAVIVTTAPHSLRCILTNCIQSLLAGLLASREPEKREHPSHTLQSHLIDYLSAKTKFCLFPQGLHSYLVHS